MDYRRSYEAWLRDFASDAETVRELTAIASDEKEIEDRFYTELSFGTAGMRGVLGAGTNRMNRYNVRKATRGLSNYILSLGKAAQRGVVIAYDSRRMSPEFAKDAALVLCECGIPAYLFDSLRPVPVLSFAVRYLGAIAGIVITASHNPAQYNGYKVYWEDGAQLPPEQADAVLAQIRAVGYAQSVAMDEAKARAAGLLRMIAPEVDDAYIQKVATLSVQPDMLKKHGGELRIVYSPVHGSGNVPVRRVLAEVGITNLLVVPEQELPDPDFSTVRVPNPEEPDTFALAIALAEKEGADAAFATDPDCDRLGVAVRDAEGKFQLLTGNQIGCLLLYYILSSRAEMGTLPGNGAAIKSIVSTELARAIAASFGVAMIDVLTGFKFIAEQIQGFEDTGSHTFLFGFEESYGFLSSTFVRDKDAVNASLLVAEMALWLKTQGRTMFDLLQEIYARYGQYVEKVLSITLPGKDGLTRMQALMADLRTSAPQTLGGVAVTAVRDYATGMRTAQGGTMAAMGLPLSDVLYYELEGGNWLCIRPSGTEPKIKVYVNTHDDSRDVAAALAQRLLKDAQGRLQ